MSVDLVEFLRARLAEDERIARRACEYASPEWHLDNDTGETVLWWPPEPHVAENERKHGLRVTADVWRGMTIDASGQQIAPHIVLHDPARVLREIEAKRVTLVECEAAERRMDQAMRDQDQDAYRVARVEAMVLQAVIRRDVAVYSDHPDFDESWRP